MNFALHLNLISGIMLGFEYVAVDYSQFIVIDLFVVRFTLEFQEV